LGVGQHEDALSTVGGTRLSRAEYVGFDVIARAEKLGHDFFQPFTDVASHVLEERPLWPALVEHPQDVGPEVPGVG
jgi:hypothetical protein